MMHDFAMTESFIVLLDLPVTFSLDMAATGNKFPYTWNRAHPARIGLLLRSGQADVRWVEIDPCFVFHTVNAYDDGRHVVLDVCCYDKAYDVATLSGARLVTLDRWVIDPAPPR